MPNANPALNVVSPTEAPADQPNGMTLPCPKCGEADATVQLDLADLDTVTCRDCGEDFTLADVRNFIAKWGKVLAWVGTFPTA